MAQTIVIIGGGIAGISAAEEARLHDAEAEIVVIEREHTPLYSRVLLPHYVKGKIPREKVFLRTEAGYLQKKLTVLLGTEAEYIDTKNTFVRISGGREIPYDKLIIATGTRPRLFSDHARGVHYLFSLTDADGVREHMGRLAPSAPVAVYGGGFIACEFINIFLQAGMKPTVYMRGSGFWSTIFSQETQAYLATVAQNAGVILHTGIAQEDMALVVQHDDLTGLVVKNEHVPCVCLGVGIGAECEKDVAREAGIATNKGIVADAQYQTQTKSVYTAGDVAEAPDAYVGRALTHGNWLHAQQEGKAAARALFSKESKLPVSQYATELAGCHIVFIGDTSRDDAERVESTCTQTGCTEIFYRNNRAVGAVLVGDISARMEWVKTIGSST